MNKPISMSIIVVDLDDDHDPTAYVTFQEKDGEGPRYSLELQLDRMTDATDARMWAQMAAARVCDAL